MSDNNFRHYFIERFVPWGENTIDEYEVVRILDDPENANYSEANMFIGADTLNRECFVKCTGLARSEQGDWYRRYQGRWIRFDIAGLPECIRIHQLLGM